jgi:DNA-binding GntR family transcriptional regulator
MPPDTAPPVPPGVAPIRRTTLRGQVTEALRNAILQGDLPPGSPLVEAALAQRLGVSRGPLREALQALTEEGLIVAEAYVGTRVAGLSEAEIEEIFSLRTELESFAFRRVWPRRSARFVDELNRRHDALLAAIAGGGGSSNTIAAEMALHSTVYEFAEHRLLLNTWRTLGAKLQLYWSAHHRAHGRRGALPTGHLAYVTLAAGDDLDAMLDEVRAHMVRGLGITQEFLRAEGRKRVAGSGA